MKLSDFHYDLPPHRIAAHPPADRDASKLMVLPRPDGPSLHLSFHDLPNLLRPGDCLVLNDSRVIPARLLLRRPNKGPCELLLTEPLGNGVWEVIARPGRRLRAGMRLDLPENSGTVEILEGGEGRTRRVRFEVKGDFLDFLQKHGHVPLPLYILHERRDAGEAAEDTAEDRERYQTVYADPPGSVAAPTAGLHFTPDLLDFIRQRGVEVRKVTLHVGPGTFEPIDAAQIETHRMHRERYAISDQDAAAIEAARRDPARRIVAVGTTTVRTLEACFLEHGAIIPATGSTGLFIRPGFEFKVTDAMVTNFHLPESTLLILVSAFAGRERVLAAYREAVEQGYRFFSYGDAMLIE